MHKTDPRLLICRAGLGAVLLLALAAQVAPLQAQIPDSAATYPVRRSLAEELPPFSPLVLIGSVAEDRARLAQLLGRAPVEGFLLRSPSSHSPELGGTADSLHWALVLPALHYVVNSDIPFSLNEGAMWAGRGSNVQLTAGVRAEYGRVSLVFAPQLRLQANSRFRTLIPYGTRDRLSSPWHTGLDGRGSADLPQRFGTGQIRAIDLGQSSLRVDAGPLAAGAATESQWWGPGMRNAIVMSNNAPGIPHLFLRTAEPIRTPLGAVEAKWLLGVLSESAYFDSIAANDSRSLNALAATFRPAFEPNLELGFARAVYASVSGPAAAARHGVDVFIRSGRYTIGSTHDQILSLFGRWVFPGDGVEVYGEWARTELPLSPRDLLTAPHHSQGYTLGLQFARPIRDEAVLRLQTELSYLELSPSYRQRYTTDYYTSRQVPHGYTQRGQVIGAAIGPGGSSQWIAADYLAPRWGAGLFAGRIRWENDTYYTQAAVDFRRFLAHDVSTHWGGRGHYRARGADVGAEFILTTRRNYLFQNWSETFEGEEAVDWGNITFRLSVTPAPSRR